MQCFRTALLLLASAPSSARASVDTFLISSGDLRVRVSYEGDSPDAYPLLLNLAGNGGWNYMSDDVAARLCVSPAFAVATYNMRGTGAETTAELPTEWETHIDDAVRVASALLRKYGRQQLVLMGYSTGTYVALEAAMRLPADALRAVVVMGLLPNTDDASAELMKEKLWQNAYIPAWVSTAVRSLNFSPLDVQLAMVNEMRQNGGMGTLLTDPNAMKTMSPTDVTTQMQVGMAMAKLPFPDIHNERVRLHCPLYVVQGSSDTMGAAELVPAAVASMAAPTKTVLWIDGAGHTPHISHPDKVCDAFGRIERELGVRRRFL